MTSSNRLQLAVVRETTSGVTPTSPRMRLARVTGEQLNYAPTFVDSDEVRPDRMNSDPGLVMIETGGSIPYELTYPDDNSPLSEFYRSAFYNAWVNTPQLDNDGTADSVITDAGTTTDTYAVAAGGAAFKTGMLVKAAGFAVPANNQVFRVVSATGTTVVGAGLNLSAEAAPAAAAKLKVVGFQGASGDITALADGLGSTILDFTTLGLVPGQWIKVGGAADASTFAFLVTGGAAARAKAWARVVAVAAAKLTLDNLPASWATDNGTGKTVKVWFGDQIKNGVAATSLTIEKGFLGQAVPTYISTRGQTVSTLNEVFASKDKIKGTATFMGLGGTPSDTPLDVSPDPVTKGAMITANANVGGLFEGGAQIVSPNWAQSFEYTIDNGIEAIESVDEQSPVALREGECKVTGKISTVFGSRAILDKFYANAATSFSCRVNKNNQAMVYQFPRVTLRGGGNPQASAKNQTVKCDFDFQSSKDDLTNAHIICDRLFYFE